MQQSACVGRQLANRDEMRVSESDSYVYDSRLSRRSGRVAAVTDELYLGPPYGSALQ